jgi:hypothetical protein
LVPTNLIIFITHLTKNSDMSHEKAVKEKSSKKAPMKSLKEKRAAKAAKRDEKGNGGKLIIPNPFAKKP